jgi:hypothetical protein
MFKKSFKKKKKFQKIKKKVLPAFCYSTLLFELLPACLPLRSHCAGLGVNKGGGGIVARSISPLHFSFVWW